MYCTVDDLKNQIPEDVLIMLTDDSGNGIIDVVKVDSAISDAAAEINSYAQSRYTVPFLPVPDIIRKVTVDIALYNLFSRRGLDEQSADQIISQRYKSAVRFLENVAKGIVEITPKDAGAKPEQQAPVFQSPPREFTRDKMKDF